MRARLFEAEVSYGGGLRLHTASSGAIDRLHELYLLVETDGGIGLGEVRVNIAYLNGLEASIVIEAAKAAVAATDWKRGAPALLADFDAWSGAHPAPVRMLLDVALHDWAARDAGSSVSALLGGPAGALSLPTNQTLFVAEPKAVVARAQAYVARGFRDLKLRVAAGDFAADLRLLAALRERFGAEVRIAVDANGRWSVEEAPGHLEALAAFDLSYVEQPVAPGDFAAMLALAETSPVPLMLDESVASSEDVERIAAASGRLWAHLKLVKLGGIAATVSAARRLGAAGVPFMIGQMNEGSAATAAALHVAAATGPRFRELYGADGLIDEPASGLAYGAGRVRLPAGPGLGIAFDPGKARLIQEIAR